MWLLGHEAGFGIQVSQAPESMPFYYTTGSFLASNLPLPGAGDKYVFPTPSAHRLTASGAYLSLMMYPCAWHTGDAK